MKFLIILIMKKSLIVMFVLSLLSIGLAAAHCIDSDGGEDIYEKGIVTGDYGDPNKTYTRSDVCGINEITGVGPIWTEKQSCTGKYCSVNEYTCVGNVDYERIGGEVPYECPFGCNDGACNKPNKPSPLIENDIGSAKLGNIRLMSLCQTILGFVDNGCIFYTANYNLDGMYISVRIEDHVKKVIEKDYIAAIEQSTESVKARVVAYGAGYSIKLEKDAVRNIYVFDKSTETSRKVSYMWLSNNKIIELEFQTKGKNVDYDFVDAYINKHPSDLDFKTGFFNRLINWFKGLF